MMYDIIHYVYFYAEDSKLKDNYIEASELITDEGAAEEVNAKEPKFRRPKRIFQKRKRRIILFILAIILLLGALTLLCFKLFEPEKEYDDSAAFYFSGNLLDENGGKVTTVYDSIEFNVYNWADSLRVSKEPLESFDVKVEAEGKDITGKSEISTGETAMMPDVRSGCTVVIELPEKYYDKKIDVTVTSSPIEKELKGSFIIKPEWDYEIRDKEGDVCAELVIFANKDVSLTVEWDSEQLIADSTDSYIRAAENGATSCEVELAGGTGVSIPMFKLDVQADFSSDDEAVKVKKSKNKSEKEESEALETSEIETEEVIVE